MLKCNRDKNVVFIPLTIFFREELYNHNHNPCMGDDMDMNLNMWEIFYGEHFSYKNDI
jgi:hypothetical protein